ncbi:hypothetical protein PHYPSEUDO_004074 [Phytophthora pseudosyringae]|uniref:RxLR effector protein n=1 Tax=Phytophthora pseudosyringae TaxID=221518 RepID=A0A8T1VQ07_9STRA|nr:hypothetical protein PHYPSEUDO_004074 [Phytophthora pseudosyringae]
MRCHFIVLLAVAAVFACGNVAVATTDSKLDTADQIDARSLRIVSKATEEEERTIGASVTEGLTKWANRILSKALLTDNDLEHLAMQATPVDDVFKRLQLDKGLDNMLTNPNFKAFGSYLLKVQTNDPDDALVSALIKQYGDKAVAEFLFDARQVKITKGVASKLQTAQLAKWVDEGKTTNEAIELLQLTHYDNLYKTLWWEYVAAHADHVSKSKKLPPVEL